MSFLESRRQTAIALALVWAYPIVAGFLALSDLGDGALHQLILALAPVPVDLAGIAIVTWLVARGPVRGRRRVAWFFMLGYLVCDFFANVAWSNLAYFQNKDYGNWVDSVYFCCYLLLAGACLVLFKDQGGTFRRRRIWLDVATFTLGLGTALWILIFGPAAHDATVSMESLLATFSYTFGNTFTMVAAALLFMQIMSWRSERSTAFLLLAALITLITDIGWVKAQMSASESMNSVADMLYVVNACAIVTAAVLEFRRVEVARQEHATEGNVHSFLPIFAVLMALVMLFGSQLGHRGVESTALLVVVLAGAALIAARQMSVRHELRDLNQALAQRQAEERLTELVRRSSDLIVVASDDALAYVSPASQQILGVAPELLMGGPASMMLGYANSERLKTFMQSVVNSETPPPDLEVTIERGNGEVRNLYVSGSDHRASRAISGLTLTIRDVTEHKKLEEQLRSLAFYDPLTLLANRSLFADRVRHAVDRISDGLTPAVMFIDLDNFKTINDGLGHSAGDKLLCTCAQRIVQGTRASDTVARLGGDEFAVLVDNAAGPDAMHTVADNIIKALAEPIDIDGRELHVTASIGICIGNERTTTERLLRDADAAMYRAKSLGKGRAVLFEAEMAKAARRRLLIEQELASALDRNEMFVHYQPIVDLKNGHLIGFEALMRWQHPTRGVVMPAEFIPVAEETGVIIPLTQWILRQSCHDAASLRSALPHGEGLRLSVNISGRYLHHKDMVSDVREALRESMMPPEALVLEVTESLLLKESPDLEKRLADLKALGVRLALDDFGTGYSSLAYLHRFPLDVLKIDRSFIQQLSGGSEEQTKDAAALAKAILSLADALGLDTVAEGIEIDAQRDALIKLGCHTGQGYSFGRPMPVSKLITTTAARRRNLIADNITGPVEFTATGRFRLQKPS